MKPHIDQRWFKRLFGAVIAVIAVKAVMVAVAFFLPTTGVDDVPYETESFYAGYRPSQLFALAEAQPEAVMQEAPVYKLDNVILMGIYKDSTMPFIAIQEGKDVVLVAKGELFKGYRLIEVHPDSAVFEKGGKRFELTFKEDGSTKQGITTATPEVMKAGENTVFVKRNEIRHYVKNYDAIWQNVKIKEVIENKRLQGFRVTWVKKGSIFDKVGLKKDDVIVGANNKKFKSLSQVFKLYNNMEEIDSMKLTVMRNNEERELEYEIFE